MDRKTTVFPLIFILLFPLAVYAQQKDSTKVKLNHYSFNLGAGWTHYINNLENGDNNIRQDFGGVSLKFYWEPEYLLSLGLETGYFRLFTVSYDFNADTSVKVVRNVVPLFLLVRMEVVKNAYIGVGMGMALITNKASGVGKEIKTSVTSLSNYELFGSYLYPLGDHFRVGGELKGYIFGTMQDWMYSVQAVVTFRL